MQLYSPFDKELQALQADDLAALKNATEGWYIEYKREVSNASSIAKSISAFANTYGGWLFYGVEELSKEDAVAGTFPGVARSEVDATLQRMRQAVASHLNPTPHFESKVVWGPYAPIGLLADRAVICVRIPWSPLAPHIHKSGIIYRRVADGSEPKPESDRFALDQLWRRADDLRKQYKDWIERDPQFSPGEGEQPYLRLLLVADPWQERGVWMKDVSIEEIRAIFGQTDCVMSSVPFDTVYTTAEGFVARQLANNDPNNLTLTWNLRRNLVSDVIIPLPFYKPIKLEHLKDHLHGYEGIERFVNILEKSKNATPRVVDLNYLFNVLIGVVEIQRRLNVRAGWTHDYHVKARILNVWRTIPFVDVPDILDTYDKYGVPMCMDAVVTSPRGMDPVTFAKVSELQNAENEAAHILFQTFMLFAPIAIAFGLPAWIENSTEEPFYHDALRIAGHRALGVQRLRNEKARVR